MIKGCQRRIIMVKDTGSRYFDSAYFVLRHDLPKDSRESDMLAEAHRMINTYTPDGQALAAPNAYKSMFCEKKKIPAALMGILMSLLSVSITIAVMLILN